MVADTTALVAAVKCHAGQQTWTDAPGANENQPMNCISWYEAMAFCAWDGGFMPTEAEWNYAASGGSEQRAYPWSSPPGSLTIDCAYANYTPASTCVAAGTNNVGSESPTGDGKWGQADLGGNVWEWTLDWYASPYPQNPCTDCANLEPTDSHVLRGGYFQNGATDLRVGTRNDPAPTIRDSPAGVRCARTAP